MKDISEYGASTSPYELFTYLVDKIISGELPSFQSIKEYLAPLNLGSRALVILQKAFALQKRLAWGFFRNLSPEGFPKVWKAVVVQDRDYPFAGDLKRFMSIPDIYMGMLDIHGYTRFCQENRHNMSMLDLLDKILQEDVRKVAAKCGVVSARAAGDEILLLAAGASDLLKAVLGIMDYFAKRRRVSDASQAGGFEVILPAFQISAGISGGQKFTPLVITQDGDLSGDIVNSAARLQARANKISPESNKILITSHVYQRLKSDSDPALAGIDFFNTGQVEFKGTSLGVYDIVFIDREAARLSYREVAEDLLESLEKGMWKSKVFEDALRLISRMVIGMPNVVAKDRGRKDERSLRREELLARVKEAQGLFAADRFPQAFAAFEDLRQDLEALERVDDLVLTYLRGIAENYRLILDAYLESLDAEVAEKLDSLYAPKEAESYKSLRKYSEMFERYRDDARLRVKNRKALWYRVADDLSGQVGFSLSSFK